MERCRVDPKALELFGELLDYPTPGLAETAAQCAQLLGPVSEKAAALLRAFERAVRRMSPGRLEEVYTSTFELDATCHPYVGYHLFGESYKRSLFLVKLKELYRATGFASPRELPDHLAVILRYLAAGAPPERRAELIREALLPALSHMLGGGAPGGEPAGQLAGELAGELGDPPVVGKPYRTLLQALVAALQLEVAETGAVAGAVRGE